MSALRLYEPYELGRDQVERRLDKLLALERAAA